MNKILVKKNKIEKNISDILIDSNEITIEKDINLDLEYYQTTDIIINFNIKENVTVNLFVFSSQNDIKVNNTYNLENNAKLNIIKFYNNQKTIEQETINLNGLASQINYFNLNISQNKDVYNININHHNQKTISNINNKIVSLDQSIVKININSNLPKNKENCILNQDSRIILLGENKSSINPNMYINNNEVSAKHASVIGPLQKQALFYLMTRGISYKDSVKLLIKGFLLSNLEINMDKREKILKIINTYWR